MARPELAQPLAVVCHDAGACNLILPWLDDAVGGDVRAVMRGPAEGLWRARFGARALAAGLDDALAGAALLLSGTGWASDLEHAARVRARALGVRSAGVVDHWVHYTDRFVRAGETCRPDEVWVTDGEALGMARRVFPPACVRLFDNAYLAEQVRTAAPLPPLAAVLYVLEPMRADWGRGRPGEFQALDHFVAERHRLGIDAAVPIRLRLHPSEPPGKYAAWLEAAAVTAPVTLDPHATLGEAVAACTWVAGCESYALVVALATGRRAVSTLPPWAPRCRLPHAGLLHLR